MINTHGIKISFGIALVYLQVEVKFYVWIFPIFTGPVTTDKINRTLYTIVASVYVHVCLCMNACVYACTCVYIRSCACVCVHVCVFQINT